MSLDHPIGPMGWGEETKTIAEKKIFESRFLERAIAESPVQYAMREAKPMREKVKAQFDKLQDACGRSANSCDMSLLDFFAFRKQFNFYPQDIVLRRG